MTCRAPCQVIVMATGLALFAGLLFAPNFALGDNVGAFQADYNHAVDGDTANLDIWLIGSLIQRGNVRLAGVDAPELRGRCASEKWLAREARDFLDQALANADEILVTPVTWSDKYGRPVMRISIDGKDLAEQLQGAGLGRAYGGGARQGWCD